jgi:hypothetical protein
VNTHFSSFLVTHHIPERVSEMANAMNVKNPVLALLGHFVAIGRYCDLCSIDMEDAVRIAQHLEGIRNRSSSASTIVDDWWREFSGYLEGLSVLYTQVNGSSGEDDAPLTKAKELVGDGNRTGQELFIPFGARLRGLDPNDTSMIAAMASDLFDSILIKLVMVIESK